MKMEITEFRDVKFGEASQEVRPLHDYSDGILWCDKSEDPKIGIVRVSEIRYGFYKGKFMVGRVKFGGEETYIIFLTALTEKYGDPTSAKPGNIWNVGNVSIYLRFNSESQVNEGSLSYEFTPLVVELKEELDKKKKEEMKMKVNAAKSDL
jgi:hypothetical protein